jgi:hypothetical protein
MTSTPSVADHALESLSRHGLLLKQDRVVPNVVSLVTGKPVSGSWWAHPEAHQIFGVLRQLARHPDVLIVKLLARKDTLVHRRLWPAVLGVGLARDAWQIGGLSHEARTLLTRVSRSHAVPASGPAARSLCERLLVHSSDVHSERGHHELVLESWSRWDHRNGPIRALLAPDGRAVLEEAATDLGAPIKWLPWFRGRPPA